MSRLAPLARFTRTGRRQGSTVGALEPFSVRRLLTSLLLGVLAVTALPAADAAIGCVGGRQTADPMAPPCVPSFTGDNGGATWDGVSASTIDVLLYNDLGISGVLNAPWAPTDEAPGHLADPSGASTNLLRTAKALVRHFNDRYQTYGRTVRVIALPSTLGEGSICAARTSDVAGGIGTYQPFAVATMGMGHGCVFDATTAAGIVGLGAAEEVRDAHVNDGRIAFTFSPTIEQTTTAAAGFICRSLWGRPASYAGGSLRGQSPRRFGLLYPSPGQSWFAENAALLTAALQARCGASFTLTRTYRGSERGGQVSDIAQHLQTFSNDALSSIVCLCPAAIGDARTAIAAANALNYEPEWIWLPATRMDRATWQRLALDPIGSHIGVSATWLAPAPDQQEAVRAARDADPGLRPNGPATTDLFVTLRLLFTAIQQAGPALTPQAVRAGLEALSIPSLAADVVQGSFDDPGRRSWSDTYVAWWFDPTSAPPGESVPRGCIKLMRDGRRFRADDWPTGDLELFAGGRCSGLLHRQPSDTPIEYAAAIAGAE